MVIEDLAISCDRPLCGSALAYPQVRSYVAASQPCSNLAGERSRRPNPARAGVRRPLTYMTRCRPAAHEPPCPLPPLISTGRPHWLHTHAADGLIVVESRSPAVHARALLPDLEPTARRRPYRHRLGALTATVNGKRCPGDPAAIPLTKHADIQLALGERVPAPQSGGRPGPISGTAGRFEQCLLTTWAEGAPRSLRSAA